jgi:hypothetical protein
MVTGTMVNAKKIKPKKKADYVLPVHFNEEEKAVLLAVGEARGPRGGTLLKLLLMDEKRRLGLSLKGNGNPTK